MMLMMVLRRRRRRWRWRRYVFALNLEVGAVTKGFDVVIKICFLHIVSGHKGVFHEPYSLVFSNGGLGIFVPL